MRGTRGARRAEGSMAIDGISLTVAAIDGPELRVALIPTPSP
jgi:riboflavin synthase alpha subunit